MNILLDTHLVIWAVTTPSRLSNDTKALMGKRSNRLVFSPANLWEVAIKRRPARPDFTVEPHLLKRGLLDSGYEELPITSEHGIVAGGLPPIHRDPFDRMLVAQATVEGMLLLTSDDLVARYPGPIRLV